MLTEACLGLREEEKDQIWKAEKILQGLGFSEEEFYKSPAEFSGGFQVRLNLAKVLLADPHLLLLDEPTNHLDVESCDSMIAALEAANLKLAESYGKDSGEEIKALQAQHSRHQQALDQGTKSWKGLLLS